MKTRRRQFLKTSLIAATGISLSPIGCIKNTGSNKAGNATNDNSTIDVPRDWTILWNDEFNGTGIDKTKWEISHYGPWIRNNVFLRDGSLHLRASMSGIENKQRFGGEVGRSGNNFLPVEPPARIEIRFKPEMKPGSFIALWAMTNNFPPKHSFEQNTWDTDSFSDYNMGVRKEFDFLECGGGENTFHHNSTQIKAHMAVHSWMNPTPETPPGQTTAQTNIVHPIDVGNPLKWQEMRIDWDDESRPGGKEVRYYWRASGKEWGEPRLIVRPERSFFPDDHDMNALAFGDVRRIDILNKIWNKPIRIIFFNMVKQASRWLSQESLAKQGKNTWGGDAPDINDYPVDVPIDYVRVFVPEGDKRI